VGGGTDYEGQIASGNHIGEAQGYVSGFSGFSSESDGSFGTNYYSLQDDSNEFSTTYSGTSVTVWQQFVFQNDPGSSSGYVFIQYWLLNYYSTYGSCPSTHTYLTAWGQSGNNCFANSNTSYSTPQENPSGLQSYEQKGYADNGGYDESVFCNGGTCYAEAVTYTVFDLAASWTVSEWNVLGFGAGSTADFSSGTSITVTQYLYNSGGTNTAVSCASNSGTSLEKNNLSLSPNCYTVTSTNYDYMYFTES
jgi:hypothetical protein